MRQLRDLFPARYNEWSPKCQLCSLTAKEQFSCLCMMMAVKSKEVTATPFFTFIVTRETRGRASAKKHVGIESSTEPYTRYCNIALDGVWRALEIHYNTWHLPVYCKSRSPKKGHLRENESWHCLIFANGRTEPPPSIPLATWGPLICFRSRHPRFLVQIT